MEGFTTFQWWVVSNGIIGNSIGFASSLMAMTVIYLMCKDRKRERKFQELPLAHNADDINEFIPLRVMFDERYQGEAAGYYSGPCIRRPHPRNNFPSGQGDVSHPEPHVPKIQNSDSSPWVVNMDPPTIVN